MVMRTFDRSVVVVLVAVAFAPGCVLFPSEEQKIVRRLEELADAASADTEPNPIIQMASAARVGRYFTEDVVVDRGDGSEPLRGRDSITALAAQARTAIQDLNVRFTDVDIMVPTADSATAHLTLVISGRERNNAASSPDARPSGSSVPGRMTPGSSLLGVGAPGSHFDACELNVTLTKVDGEWLIARVERVRTLERPQ